MFERTLTGLLWDKSSIKQPAENSGKRGENESRGATLINKPDEDKTGQGNENEQSCGNIDHNRPHAASVATLVKVIDDGDKAVARLGEVVTTVGCVDKGIGRITGSLEGDGDLRVFHSEVGDASM